MIPRLILAIQDQGLQKHLERIFSEDDVRVECFGHAAAAWQKVVRSCGDVIVISESLLPRPSDTSIILLNDLPETPITVILNDHDDSEDLARLTAAGADVVLYAGLPRKRLVEAIGTTLTSRRQFLQKERFGRRGMTNPKISDFVSDSEVTRLFMEEVQQLIPSDSPMLLLGETGVGKEHLARAIHGESPRSSGPFIAVNMAAVPEQLLESELFGHEQGAFTGAIRYRRGAFELAHSGTLFLDEIGEMPLNLQAKLLRALQDYEVKPVGGENPIWVDVRVIAATSRDLEKASADGSFRMDLFYRLSVLTLTIPPLRQRKEDIPTMAQRFVDLYRYKVGRDVRGFSRPALDALRYYNWPGNIRELMNVIERAMLLCRSDEISLADLPHVFHDGLSHTERTPPEQLLSPDSWTGLTLPEVQQQVEDRVERMYLEMVLQRTRGRVGKAAKVAGIHPRSLYNKMNRLGLRKENFKNALGSA
jgi:DNA-binding NtrC family response regulator